MARENQSLTEIVADMLSGKAYFDAWCAIVKALYRADPNWCCDDQKSAVENAVAWIERHA